MLFIINPNPAPFWIYDYLLVQWSSMLHLTCCFYVLCRVFRDGYLVVEPGWDGGHTVADETAQATLRKGTQVHDHTFVSMGATPQIAETYKSHARL